MNHPPLPLPGLLALAVGWWLILGLTSCGAKPPPVPTSSVSTNTAAPATAPKAFTFYMAEIVNRYPHDSRAFTQGLLFETADTLLESTGMHGQSSLRRVELKTGRVLQKTDLPQRYFGEGLARLNGKLYQLTWKDRKGFIYDAKTLQQTGEFPYTGEGWGLTTDGTSLILSDGSSEIRFLDPGTFAVTRTIRVTHQGKPVDHLNELEYIDGEIYANIWGADLIARLDPATGQSTGVIDCTNLFPAAQRSTPEQVLNGIAWHPETKRLLITGKWWPEVFEVRLKPR
jgi:glutamine cyclotransferase